MKKLYIITISVIMSMQCFGESDASYKNIPATEKVVVKKVNLESDNHGHPHPHEIKVTPNKKVSKKMTKEKCFKESYHLIQEIKRILDKKINEPSDTLFEKIKNSEIWKSLNKENKEKFAKQIIKWTLEGDTKIAEVKQKIAEYYLNTCNDIKQ